MFEKSSIFFHNFIGFWIGQKIWNAEVKSSFSSFAKNLGLLDRATTINDSYGKMRFLETKKSPHHCFNRGITMYLFPPPAPPLSWGGREPPFGTACRVTHTACTDSNSRRTASQTLQTSRFDAGGLKFWVIWKAENVPVILSTDLPECKPI